MSKMKASLASAAATSLVVVVAVIVFVVVLRAVNNIIFEMRYFFTRWQQLFVTLMIPSASAASSVIA